MIKCVALKDFALYGDMNQLKKKGEVFEVCCKNILERIVKLKQASNNPELIKEALNVEIDSVEDTTE